MVGCVNVDDLWLCVCVQMRTQESLKVPQLDIAVPMHLRGKNKKAGKAGFGEPSGLKRRL